MVQPRRYASLLLITVSQETAARFARLLPAERFAPEYSVCSEHEAEYILDEGRHDVILIDDSVSMNRAEALASFAAGRGVSSVLLLASPENYSHAASLAQRYGFMALPSPVEPDMLRQSLGMMAAASARIRELENKAQGLEEKMEEMRLIGRAKLILVQRFQMTEKDAHRFIEKNAMDRCVSRRTVAERIIRTYQN